MSSLRPQDRKSLCRFPAPPTILTSAPTTPAKTPGPAPPINSPATSPISSPVNTFPPAIPASTAIPPGAPHIGLTRRGRVPRGLSPLAPEMWHS